MSDVKNFTARDYAICSTAEVSLLIVEEMHACCFLSATVSDNSISTCLIV